MAATGFKSFTRHFLLHYNIGVRRWLAGLAPFILLAHTLITACVSPSILLLSQHNHWVIGKISAADWVAHTQWHWQQINGHFVAGDATQHENLHTVSGGSIIAAKGCDMQALQAFYAALRSLPAQVLVEVDGVAMGFAPNPSQVQPRLTVLHVPLPPPRNF